MINKNQFSDALGQLSVETVERYLQAEQALQRKKAGRGKRLIALIAATLSLALLLGTVALAVAFVPRSYDLDYEIPNQAHANKAVQIFYATESGKIKQERAWMPATEQNVFMTWQHLNGVGDEVEILDYTETLEPPDSMQSTVVPDSLWDYLLYALGGGDEQKTVTATLSAQIISYPDYEVLIESLRMTLAKYAGIDPEQVRILIDGEHVAIVGDLEFWHSLQGGGPAIATAGKTLELTVGMTNRSLRDIEFTGSWSAFVPDARLVNSDGYVILHEDYPMTEEYQKYVLAPGESREITYTFMIPEQAWSGKYDMVLSFGEQSYTFREAVQIVRFPITVFDEFSAFLQAYGFATSDPTAFKAAVQALSWDGLGLFDIMWEADVDWMPGYHGEMFNSETFSYSASAYAPDGIDVSYKNEFCAGALPDGMVLPFGITFRDSLVTALCKMGHTEQAAKQILEERKDVFFSSPITSTVYTDYLQFSDSGIAVVHQAGAMEVQLKFDAEGQGMWMLQIRSEASVAATEIHSVTFTRFCMDDFVYTFTAQQCQLLQTMLARAIYYGEMFELECDSACTINGVTYGYDTSQGIFNGQGESYVLAEADRVMLNAMISGQSLVSFDPDATIEVNSPYDDVEHWALPSQEECAKIVEILNTGAWQYGDPLMPSTLYALIIYDSAGAHELYYSAEAGVFQYGEFHLYLSDTDMNTVEEILAGYAVELPEE